MKCINNNKTLLKGIKRVANYYQCSVASIQKLVNEGVIPSYRIGRNRYFYAEEIDDALRDDSRICITDKNSNNHEEK